MFVTCLPSPVRGRTGEARGFAAPAPPPSLPGLGLCRMAGGADRSPFSFETEQGDDDDDAPGLFEDWRLGGGPEAPASVLDEDDRPLLALAEAGTGETVAAVARPVLSLVAYTDTPPRPGLRLLLAAYQPRTLLLPAHDNLLAVARDLVSSVCHSTVDIVTLPASFYTGASLTHAQRETLRTLPSAHVGLAYKVLGALERYAFGGDVGSSLALPLHIIPLPSTIGLDRATVDFLEMFKTRIVEAVGGGRGKRKERKKGNVAFQQQQPGSLESVPKMMTQPVRTLTEVVDRCVTRGGRELLISKLSSPWRATLENEVGEEEKEEELTPLDNLILTRSLVLRAIKELLENRKVVVVMRALLRVIGGRVSFNANNRDETDEGYEEREQNSPLPLPRYALPLHKLQLSSPQHILICYSSLLALREIEILLGEYFGEGDKADDDTKEDESKKNTNLKEFEESTETSSGYSTTSTTETLSSSSSSSSSPHSSSYLYSSNEADSDVNGSLLNRRERTSTLLRVMWRSLHTLFKGSNDSVSHSKTKNITPDDLIKTFETCLNPMYASKVHSHLIDVMKAIGTEKEGDFDIHRMEHIDIVEGNIIVDNMKTPRKRRDVSTPTSTNSSLLFTPQENMEISSYRKRSNQGMDDEKTPSFKDFKGILTPSEYNILDAFHKYNNGTKITLLDISFKAVIDTLSDISEYCKRTRDYVNSTEDDSVSPYSPSSPIFSNHPNITVSITRNKSQGLSMVALIQEQRGMKILLETFNKKMAKINGYFATTKTRKGVSTLGRIGRNDKIDGDQLGRVYRGTTHQMLRDEHIITFKTSILEALWQRLKSSLLDISRMLRTKCIRAIQTLDRKIYEGSIDISGMSGYRANSIEVKRGHERGAMERKHSFLSSLFMSLDNLISILDFVLNGCTFYMRSERRRAVGGETCQMSFVRHILREDKSGDKLDDFLLSFQQLHNPLLSFGTISGGKITPLDVKLSSSHSPTVLIGQNNGGKTSIAKAIAYSIILDGLGYPVPCSRAHSVHNSLHGNSTITRVIARGGDVGGKVGNMSSFEREVFEMKDVLKLVSEEKEGFILLILDEPCRSTSPHEAGAVLSAILEKLSQESPNVISLIITHSDVVIPKQGRCLSLTVNGQNERQLKEEDSGMKGIEGRSQSSEDTKGAELLISLLPSTGTTFFSETGFVSILEHFKRSLTKEIAESRNNSRNSNIINDNIIRMRERFLHIPEMEELSPKRTPPLTREERFGDNTTHTNDKTNIRGRLNRFDDGLVGRDRRAQPGIDIDNQEFIWYSSLK